MSYSIRIKKSAAKDLAAIERTHRERIIAAIDNLKTNPHRGTQLKGELSGLRRIRVGDYRVIYEVAHKELIVLVIRVRHRRDVFR